MDHSPIPEGVGSKWVNFYDALKAVTEGKKITKKEWADENVYGLLDSSFLRLHKADGKLYDWILNDGDIQGIDWLIL